MNPIVINAVVFQEDGMWVAQCLEYDFVSWAATKEELPSAFLLQVISQIETDLVDGREPFFEFEPAPAKYWRLLEQAKLENSKPIKPKKTFRQRLKGLVDGPRVKTQLFPVPAIAA